MFFLGFLKAKLNFCHCNSLFSLFKFMWVKCFNIIQAYCIYDLVFIRICGLEIIESTIEFFDLGFNLMLAENLSVLLLMWVCVFLLRGQFMFLK